MTKFRLLLPALLSACIISAQSTHKIKFGDISEKDFATKIYPIDSSANAVVLSDVGSSMIEGNNKGWFSLVYKRHRRVHILNKNGYDLSNVSIKLYSDNEDEEKLDKLKAVTYNLENGKVVETKLDMKEGLFNDKLNKNWIERKFTFPNVKEGSIIEYEYTITSDFLNNLQPWEYQGDYPCLWSEYNLSLPDFLGYVFLTQGYKQYDIQDRKEKFQTYQVANTQSSFNTDRYTISSNVVDYRWVMKNVNALKEENFTSSIDNHIAKIEFQLSEFRRPLNERKIIESWQTVADNLMKAEYFGEQVKKDQPWARDITHPIVKGATTQLEKARRIYDWVKKNFTCTSQNRFTMDQNLKNLVKSKKGNVAEINLLLTTLLLQEDIDAQPLILSTRSNGRAYSMYPLLSQYNYVVTKALVDGQTHFLDASEPFLGYGHLPLRCYNGEARMIGNPAELVSLEADSVHEIKYTNAFLVNGEKGDILGRKTQTPGYTESFRLRDVIREKGKEELIRHIRKELGEDVTVEGLEVDSVDRYDDVLGIKYDFTIKTNEEDIIYFDPMLGEGYDENPFKAAIRAYPVEMPYTMDETYNLQMEIPQGYVVDELPKSMVLKLNDENEGAFEYRISQSGNSISFRTRIRISRANFMPDEYDMLREFFSYVVKKQSEQIVFKKKS